MSHQQLIQGAIDNHTDDGERVLLVVDVGPRPEKLREWPAPLADPVGPDELEAHGVPVLDVPQVLRGEMRVAALPPPGDRLLDWRQPQGLALGQRQRRQPPLQRLDVVAASGGRVVAGERVDGALRGVPAQGQARQVRQAADEVAVAVAEREERGVGDHMLVAGKGVPVAGPVGEPGEGQVALLENRLWETGWKRP